MSSLQDRLNRDPEVVKLEAGESLLGTVLEVSMRESDYGAYPLVLVETDDGRELEWHAFHTVAQNELTRANPQPGDVLGVRNLGPKTGAKGNTYTGYRVVVERAERPVVTEVPARPPLPSEVPAAEVRALDGSTLKVAAPAGYDDEEPF